MKTYLNQYRCLGILLISFLLSTSCKNKIKSSLENENINNPTRFDIFCHSLASRTVTSSFYKNYVNKLELNGNEIVMDFGSGWGTMAGLIAKRLTKNGSITCLDISEAWINASKKYLNKYKNVNYLTGDIIKLTIPDTSYNAIVIHFVLHDIDSSIRQAIIEKQVKILKSGGRIYIREPLLANRGISIGYIRNIMVSNGLKEFKLELTSSWLFGDMVEGIFVK